MEREIQNNQHSDNKDYLREIMRFEDLSEIRLECADVIVNEIAKRVVQ